MSITTGTQVPTATAQLRPYVGYNKASYPEAIMDLRKSSPYHLATSDLAN
jgi:hypothetical protein